MLVELDEAAWRLVAALIARGVSHVGAELAQQGMQGAAGAHALLGAAGLFTAAAQKGSEEMGDYQAALERIRELTAERDGALARVAELEAIVGASMSGPARLRAAESLALAEAGDEVRLSGGNGAAPKAVIEGSEA